MADINLADGEPLAGIPPQDCLLTDQGRGARIAFVGRPLRAHTPAAAPPSTGSTVVAPRSIRPVHWVANEQCHSALVVAAHPARRERADGLVCDDPDVGLRVFTADCVPVLLATSGQRAALHAGWRGLAAGILAAGIATLATPPAEVTAWIGPCMGPCCYEVGHEVAARVARRCGAQVVIDRGGPRPFVDLGAGAARELRRLGVLDIRWLRRCTGCEPQTWWSYRRSGAEAGRNEALIWSL
jgi:hypothetical protein